MQGFADVQAAPCVQAMQAPLKQTRSVPQVVPSVTGRVESTQTDVPVAQLVAPWWQGFAGVQAAPAAQEAQTPALQTRSVPQVVPSATGVAGVVLSTQTDAPVAQLVTPTLHGLAGVQASPAVQPTHTPALQTWSVPHDEPSATFPVSVHTAEPLPHCTAAVLHGLAVAQAVPQAADWRFHVPDTWPSPLDVQSQVVPPPVAAGPDASGAVTTRVQPTNPTPTVSKATETTRVVPSAQLTFQAPLVPQSNVVGVDFDSSPTLVRTANVGVSGGVGVQVVVPDASGDGSTSVPERR